jgi:hypothetical protein
MPFTHEVLGAEVTTVWAFDRSTLLMRALMKHEIPLEGEPLTTLRADIGSVPRVGAHVFDQVFLAREWCRANDAVVLCSLDMLSHVSLEMLLPGEGPVTELAAVGRLPGVDPDVVRQVLLPSEALGTEMTAMR